MVSVKNNLLVGSPRKLGIRLLFLHEKSDMLLVEDLLLPQHSIYIRTVRLDAVQDFLIKLGIKPPMHLLEIYIFALYHVIVSPTKIMNRANKNWAHF